MSCWEEVPSADCAGVVPGGEPLPRAECLAPLMPSHQNTLCWRLYCPHAPLLLPPLPRFRSSCSSPTPSGATTKTCLGGWRMCLRCVCGWRGVVEAAAGEQQLGSRMHVGLCVHPASIHVEFGDLRRRRSCALHNSTLCVRSGGRRSFSTRMRTLAAVHCSLGCAQVGFAGHAALIWAGQRLAFCHCSGHRLPLNSWVCRKARLNILCVLNQCHMLNECHCPQARRQRRWSSGRRQRQRGVSCACCAAFSSREAWRCRRPCRWVA